MDLGSHVFLWWAYVYCIGGPDNNLSAHLSTISSAFFRVIATTKVSPKDHSLCFTESSDLSYFLELPDLEDDKEPEEEEEEKTEKQSLKKNEPETGEATQQTATQSENGH